MVQRSKLQHQLKTNILSTAGYKTDERYDGTRANYRKWIRSVGLNFLDIGFVDAYDDATTEGIEESTEEQWSTFYSVQDRRFMANVLISTLTVNAAEEVNSNSTGENGILILNYFYKLWGSPSLSNNINALNELFTLKVPPSENPIKHFKQLDELLTDFFPNTDDSMKQAILFRPTCPTPFSTSCTM